MPAPEIALTERFQTAFAAAFGPEYADADPIIRPSQFADFQCNAAMGLAKRLGRAPREIAAQIVEAVDLSDLAEAPEIAGPGFLNIHLRTDWIAARTAEIAAPGAALGVPAPERAETVVLDYSAPNVAKEMHVGHLRTTVVGDSIARTLEKLGHTVVRQNHIGDWGTPFGMLIEHLLEVGEDSAEAGLLTTDPNAFYQAARAKFDASEAAEDGETGFAARARRRVATLQSGDAESLRIWTHLVGLSKEYFHRIYDMLDVTLTDADLAGESSYNDQLEAVCADLEADGIARLSDGALCVFPEGFTGRDEQPLPLIIRKSDGGYGYATTDLAALRHRVRDLGADRIGYVVGTAQELHFRMVFTSAREAGWLPEQVQAEHVKIGSVLGEDGKILRTRSGASLRLMALLEEAVAAARAVIDELRPDLPEDERARIAHDIGIGGVKYADLSTAHDSDYTFDLERMLALTGNTAPYLQYAVARIRSIGRKAAAQGVAAGAAPRVQDDAERALALQLLEFGPTLASVGAEFEPHRLCAYLFSLAQAFTSFYEASPILKEADEQVRAGRLALAQLTERVLVEGLDALGVNAPQQM
ncbi:arginine--tRNA ligase [Brachybacterium saurashtrense]|uniref:Arginine--tRNA ligase n=1 Tax=Brachybacterium saurashtrense TaxID=556288 RepID=A0A345YK20_9MICO|nr:arginine--tRNA ligase [Brachybacterium saurashtrense]AXK44272.1 arginine--tRNA ligase [Brachybacterium saurashtrense]RRR21544.1 arginine--tRNA ligase [Brachybacterium saurashtrense]